MAHIPFAFSVSHFINSVGADAGFASIIGLAILVLLYFAQARETSTLRNRADDAEQRAGALEARLAQVSRAQSAQPQPVATGRPVAARPLVNPPAGVQVPPAVAGAPAPAAAAAALQSAPAGVGAPALTSATHLIPLPAAAGALGAGAALAAAEEAPATAVAAAAAPVPSALAGSPQAPASATPPNEPPADGSESPVGAPRPVTAAGAAHAAGSPSPSATAVFTAGNGPGAPDAGTNGAADHGDEYSDEFPALATQEPEPEPLPRVQLRPGGSGPVRPSQQSIRRSAPRGSSPVRRGFLVLLGVLGVAAVAAVLLIVTSSGGNTSASSSSTATTNSPAAHRRAKAKATFVASTVSVGVLNGTAQAGLAAKVMTRLAGIGYKQGITPANAANQTQTTTVVAYLPGQRAAAVRVASALKLSASAVQPIDSQTQQIACPQASSCAVDVVVTVGQDLAG